MVFIISMKNFIMYKKHVHKQYWLYIWICNNTYIYIHDCLIILYIYILEISFNCIPTFQTLHQPLWCTLTCFFSPNISYSMVLFSVLIRTRFNSSRKYCVSDAIYSLLLLTMKQCLAILFLMMLAFMNGLGCCHFLRPL